MAELITVFCTKYALTAGIYPLKGKLVDNGKYFSKDSGGKIGHFLSRSEFCLTREDALADFEHKKARKIASLYKQLAKLESLQPSIKEGGERDG